MCQIYVSNFLHVSNTSGKTILKEVVLSTCCTCKTRWFVFYHDKSRTPTLFKACVCYFSSNFYFLPNDTSLITMKNVFYFI